MIHHFQCPDCNAPYTYDDIEEIVKRTCPPQCGWKGPGPRREYRLEKPAGIETWFLWEGPHVVATGLENIMKFLSKRKEEE